MQHPKILALSDSAFRLWVKGLAYCQTQLTDGLIPRAALRDMKAKRNDVATLTTPIGEGYGALWDVIDGFGFKVHDYLFWNDSRELVRDRQRKAQHRQLFFRDKELHFNLRARDGDACRYCGRPVNWNDRKGSMGATYDHVDPKGPPTLANLVVACRGCNSRKSNRRAEEVGMRLLPVPESRIESGYETSFDQVVNQD